MKAIKQKDSVLGTLCAISCETLYGLSYIFTKQATGCSSEFALLGWRFFIAAFAMSLCVWLGLIRIDLKGKPFRPLLLVALCSPCVYFIAETVGIRLTTASESGVLLACIPAASLIASALLLDEKPTRMQVAGILVTLAGVLVTVLAVSAASSLSMPGYAFLLIAVVSYALYSVFVSRAGGYTGAEITYVMLLIGAALFILLAAAEAGLRGELAALMLLPFRKPGFLAAVVYQGIGCSVFAFFLSNLAIAKIGVNHTSSFIGIATVVSILAGALLLREAFLALQIIGAAVIIAGVYLANMTIPGTRSRTGKTGKA